MVVLGNTSHYVNDLMALAIKYKIPVVIVDPHADRGKRSDERYYGRTIPCDFIIIDGIYLL